MELLRFFRTYSRRIPGSRTTVVLVLLTGFISGASNAAILAVINKALAHNGFTTPALGWSFIGLCLVLPLTRFVSRVLLIRLTARLISDLRLQMCSRILSAPLRLLEELGPHRLLATLTDDLPAISNAFTNFPLLCMHISIILACLIYLSWLSWSLMIGVLGFMAVGIVVYRLLTQKGLRHFKFIRESWDQLFKNFRALTQGTKELKLHRRRREDFLSNQLRAANTSFREHSVIANTIYTVAASWGQGMFFVLLGLLFVAAPAFRELNTQVLTAYCLILLYMMTPLEVILNLLPILSRAAVAVRKVESLGLSLSSQSSEDDAAPSQMNPFWGELELAGVTHTYRREGEDNDFVLGPIDLTLRRGEVVILAGGNGSGKTTLAKLIVGLYVPESGEIRLDGVPISAETKEYYRQYFSAVFSDFYLFENLLGLDAEALEQRAAEYLGELQLDHKVKINDGVFSTIDLSQGQRKRLALLTAYLENRPICVFDEWAADQDPLFKKIFYLELLPEMKARGKTVLVISHDDQYYYVADRVITLVYGKLVSRHQVGDHQDTAIPHY